MSLDPTDGKLGMHPFSACSVSPAGGGSMESALRAAGGAPAAAQTEAGGAERRLLLRRLVLPVGVSMLARSAWASCILASSGVVATAAGLGSPND